METCYSNGRGGEETEKLGEEEGLLGEHPPRISRGRPEPRLMEEARQLKNIHVKGIMPETMAFVSESIRCFGGFLNCSHSLQRKKIVYKILRDISYRYLRAKELHEVIKLHCSTCRVSARDFWNPKISRNPANVEMRKILILKNAIFEIVAEIFFNTQQQ